MLDPATPAPSPLAHPFVVALVWLPTDPPRPAPAIMIAEEVCAMLRVNTRGLHKYHNDGRLRGFQCGRRLAWKLSDVLAFADAQKELNR
jgi:hypothetical protein